MRYGVAALLLMLVPASAHAEAADKVWGADLLLPWWVVMLFVCYAYVKTPVSRRLVTWIIIPLWVWYIAFTWQIHEPGIYEALRKEKEPHYYAMVYCAGFAAFAMQWLVLRIPKRRVIEAMAKHTKGRH